MPTTRLESTGQIDALLEELKSNSSGICIVSTHTLEMLIQDNANLHKETRTLNERVAKSAEQLNLFLESNAAAQSAASKDLNDRLDLLIEKISTSSSFSRAHDETNIDALLKKRKVTIEKLTRNQEMSKYYDEQLNEPEPFVRREFRTRVNKTTSERELTHRRQQTIERVKTEIKVMEDRVIEHTELKNSIDLQIQEYLSSNESKRDPIEQQMGNQIKSVKESFERNTMVKLKKTDEEEKMHSFEYLITVADNNDSLNYRGRGSRARQKRGRGQVPYQQEY